MKSVLIIEDDLVTQSYLKKFLKMTKYEAVTASNGAEGLFYYLPDPTQYQAVILDLMMPVVTGDDFLRIILSLIERNLIPAEKHIIVATAVESFLHLKGLLAHPSVFAVVQKPFELDQFLRLLERSDQELESQVHGAR